MSKEAFLIFNYYIKIVVKKNHIKNQLVTFLTIKSLRDCFRIKIITLLNGNEEKALKNQ